MSANVIVTWDVAPKIEAYTGMVHRYFGLVGRKEPVLPDIQSQTFRIATAEDAPMLHVLTGRSVLHWGYDPSFLEWKPEAIAVTPAFLASAITWILASESETIGYYSLVEKPDAMYLDKLFIEPVFIRRGYGRVLWDHAMATARERGHASVMIEADPNAAPFYAAMGSTWLAEHEMSWPGWKLQEFRYDLPPETGPTS